MLKSIGRSSHLEKIVGGTVSPPPVYCKTVYRLTVKPIAAGKAIAGATVRRCDGASRTLTFPSSNHSFIQLFELQCLPLTEP
jgi:hypothetical protein